MPNKQITRRKSSKARVASRRARLPTPMHMPQTEVWPVTRHKLRFYSVGATLSVTASMLLDAINVATTATALFQLYDFVRVKRISMWGISSTVANSIAAVSVAFTGATAGATGNDLELHDVSMNSTVPAFITCKPPPGALSTLWQANTASVLFRLSSQFPTAGGGLTAVQTTVELDLEYRMDSDTPPLGTTNAAVGATAGIVYFRGLDQLAKAATAWLPMQTPID